jgi:hypothetical protein
MGETEPRNTHQQRGRLLARLRVPLAAALRRHDVQLPADLQQVVHQARVVAAAVAADEVELPVARGLRLERGPARALAEGHSIQANVGVELKGVRWS